MKEVLSFSLERYDVSFFLLIYTLWSGSSCVLNVSSRSRLSDATAAMRQVNTSGARDEIPDGDNFYVGLWFGQYIVFSTSVT